MRQWSREQAQGEELQRVSESFGEAKEENTKGSSEEKTETAAADEDSFEDNRNIGKELRTLNNRMYLYKAVIVSFREEPLRMLIGSGDAEDMLYYANYVVQTSQHYEHMHNFLLQVLMMTGIPGFLLVLAFCVLLVIRMVRLFFSDANGKAEKTLVIPAAGLLIHFMLETGLFTSVDVRGLFFFLMAGFIFGSAQPERKQAVFEKQRYHGGRRET